ncbi:cupin domain-containing protein [Rhizobium leguminosarum]|uniref:cupin domain-containing protein n=1 Tax=Rhizobium TaxID=379 RepID=UPI0010300286|nr:cupin domain-containing protein [Rhizobium leguminosarum]TBF45289.1 AraC family transcriptional regulator [Rhizobium leguminosarum]TBG99174.1 AraC family transcriptional regulator [Rhizobium leguminosarum]
MPQPIDWLSRLLEIMPVSGRLELRCLYGAPWQVVYGQSGPGDIVYHVVLSGVAIVKDPDGGPPRRLGAGDILLVPTGAPHILHDGSGAEPIPATQRIGLNLTISENTGSGEQLDMLCGRFVLSPPHYRLLGAYLSSRLIVRGTPPIPSSTQSATREQLSGLLSLMRAETGMESLGGHAMLNAFSAALFTLALRLASESDDMPPGLLALASHPRLAPALSAMFLNPTHPWTLPKLADLCNMSRATLARHFQDGLGRSANDLLLNIRMTLAANELKKANASTAAAAEAAGYESDAAFQRVFKRHLGMTPAQWRDAARSVVPKSNE